MSNGISFEADHLLDKDDLTSWQYDITETGGQPAYVVFELGSPAAVTQLAIKNGYWKISSGYDQYTRNGRVREFEVSFMYLGREHEGYQDAQYYWLEDEKREQFFDLGCVQNVISVRLRIQSIYQGTKFVNDVAMNDVKLFGYPSE